MWERTSLRQVVMASLIGSVIFSELFDTNVRYSGGFFRLPARSAIAGGFAPLIATALLTGYGYPTVALYMIVMALITIVAVYLATETYQRDIARRRSDEERPASGGRAMNG
jgi:MFS transporter, MHS family, shikimate and dehydroshikimate transport protein